MAVTIGRTAWTDDDGTGTTGTVINNAEKTALYNQIDAVLATITPAAGQLVFPATQNPSANVNTLDDYEEGTWTPVWTGLTVVGTPTYNGTYVKIGKLVYCTVYISSTTSTASTANTTSFTGLPYAQAANPVISVCMAARHDVVASFGNGVITASVGYPPTWAATSQVALSFSYIAAN